MTRSTESASSRRQHQKQRGHNILANPETIIKNKGLLALDKYFFRGRFMNNPTGVGVPREAIQALRARFHYLPEVVEAIDRLPNIRYGLPGSSDTIGVVPVTVTAEMVGAKIGVAVCVEFKTDTGRQSDKQKKFERAVNAAGGVYVIERSHVGIGERVWSAIRDRCKGGTL